jgi:3-hydroxyacyl-CoA dehydrogenase/3a,7a,12a-trihydroxy-5b-cholest-24-enoyl-CoA hydratase
MDLRFDGRVVIVTGAGQGLGRSHALEFGRRGAKVVVNDLGGGARGDGASAQPAHDVAEEIRAAGGEAVANASSVENGGEIVDCALNAFGRVDVVVNNAGILRDASFAKMTERDWDLVYRTHLLGAFRVTQAAWPHMRDAGYGRVLVTTSAAGLYGNFGQANYSAAKLGLVGLALALAAEGRSRNILVNALSPTAASRLTAPFLPEGGAEALRPEYVTALAILLTHEGFTGSGQIFEASGGWVSQVRWEQSQGVYLRDDLTPETLHARWAEVTSFENSRHISDIADVRTGLEGASGSLP